MGQGCGTLLLLRAALTAPSFSDTPATAMPEQRRLNKIDVKYGRKVNRTKAGKTFKSTIPWNLLDQVWLVIYCCTFCAVSLQFVLVFPSF